MQSILRRGPSKRVTKGVTQLLVGALLGANACSSDPSDTTVSNLGPERDAGDAGDRSDPQAEVRDAGGGDVAHTHASDSDPGTSGPGATDALNSTSPDAASETYGEATALGSTGGTSTGADATSRGSELESVGTTASPSDATGSDATTSGTTETYGATSDGTTSDGNVTDDATPVVIMPSDVVAAAEALMTDVHFPGMALATFDSSGVTWARGLGFADSALTRPVTPDTSFWLASVTKPFTGVALLRAIEETELNLETDIGPLLADNAAFSLATTESVTIRELVTHHSPIRDSSAYLCSYYVGTAEEHQTLAGLLGFANCDEGQPVALEDYLHNYLGADGAYYQTSHFATDAGGFAYSNVGAALAGYAVELATERSLAAYAREELFVPLGLTHTSYDVADLDVATLATPTRWDAAQQTHVDYPLYELSTWPGGGLRSSVADLSKLSAALLAGGTFGETQVLASESVAAAFSPLESADVGDVGVFWLVGNDSSYAADGSTRRLAGENGGDPGAATMLVLDLDNDFGIVILANGELADQAAAERTNELARLLYRFAEQQANAN